MTVCLAGLELCPSCEAIQGCARSLRARAKSDWSCDMQGEGAGVARSHWPVKELDDPSSIAPSHETGSTHIGTCISGLPPCSCIFTTNYGEHCVCKMCLTPFFCSFVFSLPCSSTGTVPSCIVPSLESNPVRIKFQTTYATLSPCWRQPEFSQRGPDEKEGMKWWNWEQLSVISLAAKALSTVLGISY